MAKRSKGYLGLGQLISIILAIFFIGWILATVERVLRGNIIGAILTFFFWPIFMIIDIVTLILSKDITFLA